MKLFKFRIKNFKSIADTGDVYLPSIDLITAIAGQNESGKTAVLKALWYFEQGNYDGLDDDERIDCGYPYVEVTFTIDDEEYKKIAEMSSKKVADYFRNNGVTWCRGDEDTCELTDIMYLEPDDEELEKELERLRSAALNVEVVSTSSDLSEDEDRATTDSDSGLVNSPSGDDVDILSSCFDYFGEKRPIFIYYSSELENNILPSEIAVSEIQKNQAVLDFQRVYGIDFKKMLSDGVTEQARTMRENKLSAEASDSLNRYWKQKISGEDVEYKYSIRLKKIPNDASSVAFYVEQNDGIPLKMAQKSRGFRWFAGFILRLRAHACDFEEKRVILLIDEPGIGLHEVAQNDLKNVMEEISKERGIQIIYSSHLPIMLGGSDLDLSRILLVGKNKEGQTFLRTISQATAKSGMMDALAPIRTALGLVTIKGFGDRTSNLVVEGITDFYYLKGGLEDKISIIPAGGADQVPNVFAILYGWGLSPKALLDGDRKGMHIHEKLKKEFFSTGSDDSALDETIMVLDGKKGIEEILTPDDVKNVIEKAGLDYDYNDSVGTYENIDAIGKIIFAKFFAEIYLANKMSFSEDIKSFFKNVKEFCE